MKSSFEKNKDIFIFVFFQNYLKLGRLFIFYYVSHRMVLKFFESLSVMLFL